MLCIRAGAFCVLGLFMPNAAGISGKRASGVRVLSQPAQLTSGHEKPEGLMKILDGLAGKLRCCRLFGTRMLCIWAGAFCVLGLFMPNAAGISGKRARLVPIAGVRVLSQPAQLTSKHEKPEGLMKILDALAGKLRWCCLLGKRMLCVRAGAFCVLGLFMPNAAGISGKRATGLCPLLA